MLVMLDEYALAANLAGKEDKLKMDIDHEEELSAAVTENYRTLIVQRVLSTQIKQAEQLQRHNLFQMSILDVPHSQGLSCSSHY